MQKTPGPKPLAKDPKDEPAAPKPEIEPGAEVGGPKGDPPFRGRNAGVDMGRPSEDDRAGRHDHDGWNSNT